MPPVQPITRTVNAGCCHPKLWWLREVQYYIFTCTIIVKYLHPSSIINQAAETAAIDGLVSS